MKNEKKIYSAPNLIESAVCVESGIAASGEVVIDNNDYGYYLPSMCDNGFFF